MNANTFAATWSPRLLAALRIVAGLLFLQHGSQKLLAFPPSSNPGSFDLFSLVGIAGILEFFGGILIVLGLFTRPVAFILSGEMAVAYWSVHAPRAPSPIQNGGEMAVLYCFIFLYLAAAGGGCCSADQAIQKQRQKNTSGDRPS